MTATPDHDMRNQVTATIAGHEADYDIPGIVDEIQASYGTVDIHTVDGAVYWKIVDRHDISAAA